MSGTDMLFNDLPPPPPYFSGSAGPGMGPGWVGGGLVPYGGGVGPPPPRYLAPYTHKSIIYGILSMLYGASCTVCSTGLNVWYCYAMDAVGLGTVCCCLGSYASGCLLLVLL